MGQKFSSDSIEKIRIKEPNFKTLEANDIDITKYTKLKTVDLRRGRIANISPSITDNILSAPKLISTLVKLNLSHNKLENLPKEFCLLINLKRLHLENNRLTVLPEEFPQLYRLEKLSLNNNKLKYLPANMKNLVHLKSLLLHENNLAFLPNDLGDMIWIDEITIDGNDDLDERLLTYNNLFDLLAHIKSKQVIKHKYREDHKEYLTKIKSIKNLVYTRSGYHELKEPRMKTFLQMLSEPHHYDLFYSFLKKEFASESLSFYNDCKKFREVFSSDYPIHSDEVYKHGLKIYKKYIDDSDDSETINIPSNIKNDIKKAFKNKEVDQFVFVKAILSILKLLLNDSLKRFVETETGKAVWSMYSD